MRVLFSLALASTVWIAGCGPDESRAARGGPPNVVLICMDTVRADRLGCYGYGHRPTTPRLDKLARESTLFADASATSGWTKPSVPSFLTGTYPLQHGVYEGSARGTAGSESDVLGAEATTLAEVFAAGGYSTAAFVRNAQLARGKGFEQGFADYVDEAGDAREIRWRAQDWIDESAGARPFFLYLHFLDAHWPYDVPDEYAAKFAPRGDIALFRDGDHRALRDAINDGARVLSAGELDALGALYDGSLRSIDDELARLFAHLERVGEWNDTIVCVISDHGEEFMEHGRLGHGHGLSELLLRVPWILRVPGRAAARVETPVSLIDLFATLLGAAGLDAPANEGVDRLAEPERARAIFAEHKEPDAYQQSLKSDATKLVRRATVERKSSAGSTEVGAVALATRWEVALDVGSPGDEPIAPRAKRVESRAEPATDPLEIKGRLSAASEREIVLHGWTIALSDDTELYGALPAGQPPRAALAAGAGVKAQCESAGGGLRALRIKLYPAGDDVDDELRGTLQAVDGTPSDGRIQLSGVWVDVGARTQWKDAGDVAGERLPRERLHELFDPSLAPDARVVARVFELRGDPLERAPLDGAGHELCRGADALTRALATRRTWTAADRVVLDEPAIEALRELGYAR